MKTLLPCLACGELIGRNAQTCPKCGEANGEIHRLKGIRVQHGCSLDEAKRILARQME
ncbi:hypothetical protein LOM8899_02231 [Flavimaricola marinus]|uniref:Zinc-ribbon domain-containing protein n=1 Tax=Flavimaricola marinus TaxID=1819565 RepID=A0A238LEU2_9RHOB|nr:hypothetical protein LOM8899_02231 [Flavimaricola marinus]